MQEISKSKPSDPGRNERVLGIVLFLMAMGLFAIYATGQLEHTLRFICGR